MTRRAWKPGQGTCGGHERRAAAKTPRHGHGQGLAAWAQVARASERSTSVGVGEGRRALQAGKDPYQAEGYRLDSLQTQVPPY